MTTKPNRPKRRRKGFPYPHRWKYPLNVLDVGASFTVAAAAYWPLNAARTRAEQALRRKFSISREGETVTVTRLR